MTNKDEIKTAIEALNQIANSSDSKWQSDCAKKAMDIIGLSALAVSADSVQEQHYDDYAVDCFAELMKEKLRYSREVKGRGGWDDPQQCSVAFLNKLLLEHVEKGDPVDVANLCMMLRHYDAKITAKPQDSAQEVSTDTVSAREELEYLRGHIDSVRNALGCPDAVNLVEYAVDIRASLAAGSSLRQHNLQAGEPAAWMVKFEARLGGARVTDRLIIWRKEDAKNHVREELIESVEPLYTAPPSQQACKDAQRLDFMIAEECQVWEVNGRYSVHAVTEHHPRTGEYPTAREAIDATMQASPVQADEIQDGWKRCPTCGRRHRKASRAFIEGHSAAQDEFQGALHSGLGQDCVDYAKHKQAQAEAQQSKGERE